MCPRPVGAWSGGMRFFIERGFFMKISMNLRICFLINFIIFNEFYWYFIGFRNRHNFWWWCPQTLILELLESPESQLSNGIFLFDFDLNNAPKNRFPIETSDFQNSIKIIDNTYFTSKCTQNQNISYILKGIQEI